MPCVCGFVCVCVCAHPCIHKCKKGELDSRTLVKGSCKSGNVESKLGHSGKAASALGHETISPALPKNTSIWTVYENAQTYIAALKQDAAGGGDNGMWWSGEYRARKFIWAFWYLALQAFHNHFWFYSYEVKTKDIFLSFGATFLQNSWIFITCLTIFNLFQMFYFWSAKAKYWPFIVSRYAEYPSKLLLGPQEWWLVPSWHPMSASWPWSRRAVKARK